MASKRQREEGGTVDREQEGGGVGVKHPRPCSYIWDLFHTRDVWGSIQRLLLPCTLNALRLIGPGPEWQNPPSGEWDNPYQKRSVELLAAYHCIVYGHVQDLLRIMETTHMGQGIFCGGSYGSGQGSRRWSGCPSAERQHDSPRPCPAPCGRMTLGKCARRPRRCLSV